MMLIVNYNQRRHSIMDAAMSVILEFIVMDGIFQVFMEDSLLKI